MSQIDREMEQAQRRSRSVTLFSTVGALAMPVHGVLTHLPRDSWLRRTSRALEHVVDTLLTWRERARTRQQLMMLDDRLLKDIGITRLQAQGEASKPFWKV